MANRYRHASNWRDSSANKSSDNRFYHRPSHGFRWRSANAWRGPDTERWRDERYRSCQDYQRSKSGYHDYSHNFNGPHSNGPPEGFGVFVGSWYMDFGNPSDKQPDGVYKSNCSSGNANGWRERQRPQHSQNRASGFANGSSAGQKAPQNSEDVGRENHSASISGSKAPLACSRIAQHSNLNVSSSVASKSSDNSRKGPEKSPSKHPEKRRVSDSPIGDRSGRSTRPNGSGRKRSQSLRNDLEPLSSPSSGPATETQNDSICSSSNDNRSQEALSRSDVDGKSSSSSRPKVDLKVCKKKSNTLSKEDLMKLISSPRSRQEHLQLNRILKAHAERQKNSAHHTSALEPDDHEALEHALERSVSAGAVGADSCDIEAIELPAEIQHEISELCEGVLGDFETSPRAVNDVEDNDVEGETDDVAIIGSSHSRRRTGHVRPEPRPQNLPNEAGGSGRNSIGSVRQNCRLESPVVVDNIGLQRSESSLSSGRGMSLSPVVVTPAIVSSSCSDLPLSAGSSANESRVADNETLSTVLQISLREEEILRLLKDAECEIAAIESEIKCLKEKLKDKLICQSKLVEEKLSLRLLRLQLLRGSFDLGQEFAETVIPEAASAPSSRSVMEDVDSTVLQLESSASNVDFASADVDSNNFNSILRNGFISIEPINDGQEFEDTGPCGPLDCFENVNTVQPITIQPVGDDGVNAEPTVPAHVEYLGSVNALSLQPFVLQEIVRGFQPQNLASVPPSGRSLAENSVNEFSCSEDETVERSGGVDNSAESDENGKSRTHDESKRKSSSAEEELNDCVISRIEKRGSKTRNRSLSEKDTVAVSDASSSHKKSKRPSFSKPVAAATASKSSPAPPVAVFIDLDPDRPKQPTSASTGLESRPKTSNKASSDNGQNSQGKVGKPASNKVPVLPPSRTSNSKKSKAPTSATHSSKFSSSHDLSSRSSEYSGPSLHSRNRPNENDYGTRGFDFTGRGTSKVAATGAMNGHCSKNFQPHPDAAKTLKRKSLDSFNGPDYKRKRFQGNSADKRDRQNQNRPTINIYPSASISVLHRHTESARSIILSDEVIVTASDDGQIVQHQVPRTIYGQAEKLTFAGHATGVVGLILAQYRVSKDITKAVILSIGRDQLIKMHCPQTGKVMMTHKFAKGICYDCVAEAGGTIFVGLEDGSIARLATSTFSVKDSFTYPLSSRVSALVTSFGVKRHLLLIGFGDCSISVRDALTNSLVQTLNGHVRAPRFLLMLNKFIVSSSGDCSVIVHGFKSGESSVNTLHLPFPVVAMSSKDKLLLVATKNKTITCIDIQYNQRYIILLRSIENPLTCLVASNYMVYFGCCNGFVYHADVDMRKHWKCGFKDCRDWFFWKGDLEEHIRGEHRSLRVPVMIQGQYLNPCGWKGCSYSVSQKKPHKALSHYLKHLGELEPAETVLSSSTD